MDGVVVFVKSRLELRPRHSTNSYSIHGQKIRCIKKSLPDPSSPLCCFNTQESPQERLQKIPAPTKCRGEDIKLLIYTAVDKSHKRLTLSQPTEFLAGTGRDQLSKILGAAEIRKISAGQIILREGTPPAHLFLLKSGRAKFYRLTRSGGEVLLSLLAPGDAFGLGTLLARPVPYIGTAETTRDSELLVWEQARIRRLAQKYPRLAQNALVVHLVLDDSPVALVYKADMAAHLTKAVAAAFTGRSYISPRYRE
ncbi:MAG: hypothetical protein DMG11_01550 [Acidobacteria bacterium]|nr:MAG: hypothetical protein DMG11_01550 [Acidobacteriota bacterium]